MAAENLLNYTFAWSLASAMCHCPSCGIPFAVPLNWQQEKRRDHSSLYCPNGHKFYYPGKSREEQLNDELAVARVRLTDEQARRQREVEARQHAERSASAYRGKVTLIKNRVGNGVCPCCRRTFQNLMKHMHTQHPTWKAPEAE